MRHPFWLINSVLLAIAFFSFLFIIISRPTIPTRISIEPTETIKPIVKDLVKIDLSKIYANDLFDTYQPVTPPTQQVPTAKQIPKPPMPKMAPRPAAAPLKFLEPLKITLRGIITSSNEQMNVAIIEDAKEKKSRNYKVGSVIEDAQLIRILKNKIILIRSNGQQETLYINQRDAELDQALSSRSDWSPIIKNIGQGQFEVYADLFVERVRTISSIIDLLNLTSVYRQGKVIGCRVGKLEPNSLGHALGVHQSDIITKVNNIEATDVKKRFEIYQNILGLDYDDVITVELTRAHNNIVLTYTLKKQASVDVDESKLLQPINESISEQENNDIEKIKALEQHYKFAPTIEEIQKKEKSDMIKMSRRAPEKRKIQDVLMSTVKTK